MTVKSATLKAVGSSMLLLLVNVSNGQTLPDTLLASGGVPVLTQPDTIGDSLQLALIDQAIMLAEIEERQTSFWFRLIPEIRVSANVGVQQLVFVDPTSFTPYVMPRDAYRMSLSVSLSDVFNFDKHTTAQIQRNKLEVQRQLILRNLHKTNEEARRSQDQLQHDLLALKQQGKLINDLAQYTEMLFNQGEIKFDELIRVRLQQLHIQNTINRLLFLVPNGNRQMTIDSMTN